MQVDCILILKISHGSKLKHGDNCESDTEIEILLFGTLYPDGWLIV